MDDIFSWGHVGTGFQKSGMNVPSFPASFFLLVCVLIFAVGYYRTKRRNGE